MTDTEAEEKRIVLVHTLDETEQLLCHHGERHWEAVVAESCRLIELRDFAGVQLIRSSFGGMGSFNDLIIHSLNGHSVSDNETDSVNERLRSLQGRIYELSCALSRYETQNDGQPNAATDHDSK